MTRKEWSHKDHRSTFSNQPPPPWVGCWSETDYPLPQVFCQVTACNFLALSYTHGQKERLGEVSNRRTQCSWSCYSHAPDGLPYLLHYLLLNNILIWLKHHTLRCQHHKSQHIAAIWPQCTHEGWSGFFQIRCRLELQGKKLVRRGIPSKVAILTTPIRNFPYVSSLVLVTIWTMQPDWMLWVWPVNQHMESRVFVSKRLGIISCCPFVSLILSINKLKITNCFQATHLWFRIL